MMEHKIRKKRGGKMPVILAALGLAIVLAAGFVLLSPWPAVWILRHGEDGTSETLPGFEERTAGVTVQKDLVYESEYGKNRFDLYLPETAEKAPLILWIHGGAFVAGDKSGLKVWGPLLASEGYAVAAMNYEWAPEEAWPAQIIQIRECMDEVRTLAENKVPVDMDRVFLAGDSAGAHMAAQAAALCFNPEYRERTGVEPPMDEDELKGVLLYCGPYELSGFAGIDNKILNYFMNKIGQSYVGSLCWQESGKTEFLNIIPWMTEKCPPVYLTDCNTGSFESQGRHLGAALRGLGVEVTERYFGKEEGAVNHEYQMQLSTPQGQACWEDTLEFLGAYSGRKDREHG